jgi:hypothetical protein
LSTWSYQTLGLLMRAPSPRRGEEEIASRSALLSNVSVAVIQSNRNIDIAAEAGGCRGEMLHVLLRGFH